MYVCLYLFIYLSKKTPKQPFRVLMSCVGERGDWKKDWVDDR